MNKLLILACAVALSGAARASDITLGLAGSQCNALGGGSVSLDDLWRSQDLKYSYRDSKTEGPKIGNQCSNKTTGWVCEGPQKMFVQYESWVSGYGCETCTETWTVENDIIFDTTTGTRVSEDYFHFGPDCNP